MSPLVRAFAYVVVALPPVVLATVGLTHPMHLTEATALYWRTLHIAILPIFPLLGFAPWLVVRGVPGSSSSGSSSGGGSVGGENSGRGGGSVGAGNSAGNNDGAGIGRSLTWTVGILGFVYAAFYTALDVLAGIGAGGLKLDGMGMAVGTLYRLADSLGLIGSVALVIASVLATGVAAVRAGVPGLIGGALAVTGSVLFLREHIYFPVGVAGQLCLAVGWSAVVFALRRSANRAAPFVRQ